MEHNRVILNFSINEVLDFAREQLKRTADKMPDIKYPRSTINGNKEWKLVPSDDWTSGFYPGCLWYAYESSGNELFIHLARIWTAALEREKYNISSHDIGFMIYCSFGNGYRLTGDEGYKEVILAAAGSLARRYNEKVGCIRSWDFGKWKFPVIIDSIMNLELLFWAAENGGDPGLYDIAFRHAETALENHLREDGSIYHLVDYDPNTGEILSRETGDSKDPSITWTRGHSWAVYGYPMAYRFTGHEPFLEAAVKLADNFISNLSEDYIPYWVVNERMNKKDSSAAAIAASGLLELATYLKDEKEETKYIEAAEKMLSALATEKYFAKGTESPSILLQGMGGDHEMDTALIYGDYYFIEALLRYKKLFDI